MLSSIYAPYMYAHMCMNRNTHHWLNQAFAVAKGYLANRIMAHCLVPVFKNDDNKRLGYTNATASSHNSVTFKVRLMKM